MNGQPPAAPARQSVALYPARPLSILQTRVVRFAAVGLLGTALDFSLFLVMQSLLQWPAGLANILSYSAGIINNYLLHRAWTFSDRAPQAAGRQFLRFTVVSLSALLLNTLIVLLLAPLLRPYFTGSGLAEALAKACATAAGLGWNFFANQRWTFSRPGVRLKSGEPQRHGEHREEI